MRHWHGMHAAPCGRLDHLSKQSRQQLQKLLHQSCICQLCMVRCCEDTLSSRPEAHAVLTAGAKSGTSHIQRRQALVQLLLALQKQHESMHWNLKTLRTSQLASLSSCCRSMGLHTLAISGDDALPCEASGSGQGICNLKSDHHCCPGLAQVYSFMSPGLVLHGTFLESPAGAIACQPCTCAECGRHDSWHRPALCNYIMSCNVFQEGQSNTLSPQGSIWPALPLPAGCQQISTSPIVGPIAISGVGAGLADCTGKIDCALHD